MRHLTLFSLFCRFPTEAGVRFGAAIDRWREDGWGRKGQNGYFRDILCYL